MQRFTDNLKELDEQSTAEHMYGPRGPWHVHKRAQNCFICDYSTMINQITEIMIQLIPLKSNARLTFETTKEGSQRLNTKP